MKKLLLITFVLLLITSIVYAVDPRWVCTPADMLSEDQGNFSGQDCTPEEICGDSSGIAQCYEADDLVAPSSNTTATSDIDDGTCDGGYIIQQYITADAASPFCDNSGNFWCDRNSTMRDTWFRQTVCVNGTFGHTEFGDCRSTYFNCYGDLICESQSATDCSNCGVGNCRNSYDTATCDDWTAGGTCECDTNYFACDGSINDNDGCEINAGASCGSATGTIQLDECFNATLGNCTRSGTNIDCNDGDSDSDITTCNPGSPDDGCEITGGGACDSSRGTYGNDQCVGTGGNCTASGNYRDCDDSDSDSDVMTCNSGSPACEIELTVDTNNSNSIYQTCTTFACASGWEDCDGPGTGADADGCEYDAGGTCATNAVNGSSCAGCACSSGYLDCDTDILDGLAGNGCEIQEGASCGSGTGTYAVGECQSSTGNCTATGTNADCNDDDSDGNNITCNGADGCEINIGTDTNNSRSVYQTCTTFACQSSWSDCNGPGTGADVDGCEIEEGSSCTQGGITGTYSGCDCVVARSLFWTGNLTEYFTALNETFLWFYDWGNGNRFVANGTNNKSVIINGSGYLFVEGFGFFDYLGDALNWITEAWITTLNVIGINATDVNATNFYRDGISLIDANEFDNGTLQRNITAQSCSGDDKFSSFDGGTFTCTTDQTGGGAGSVNGTDINVTNLWVNPGDITIESGQILTAEGTASTPSIASRGDTNLGIYFNDGFDILFSTGGNQRAEIDSFGIESTPAGSEGAPSIRITSDSNTGFWSPGTDQSAWGAGGVEFITLIESTDDVLVVNEDGDDIDFRVEGDVISNLFLVDGGLSQILLNGTIQTNITSCTEALETDSSGNIVCGTDATGAGGATFDQDLNTTSNVTFNKVDVTENISAQWSNANVESNRVKNPPSDCPTGAVTGWGDNLSEATCTSVLSIFTNDLNFTANKTDANYTRLDVTGRATYTDELWIHPSSNSNDLFQIDDAAGTMIYDIDSTNRVTTVGGTFRWTGSDQTVSYIGSFSGTQALGTTIDSLKNLTIMFGNGDNTWLKIQERSGNDVVTHYENQTSYYEGNVSANSMYVSDKTCYNADCSKYITANSTHLIIQT